MATDDKQHSKRETTYWILGIIASFIIPMIVAIGSWYTLQGDMKRAQTDITSLQSDVKSVKEVQANDTKWLDGKKLDTEIYNRQREEDKKQFEQLKQENREEHKSIADKLDRIIEGLSKRK